jgi:glycosyltransferase involved in cell wall biosynthesis
MHKPCERLPTEKTVSVIIPTMCEASRSVLIHRAIESVLTQSGVIVEILIIINGNRYDQQLAATLKTNSRLNLIWLDVANVSTARYKGVCHAQGEYFCFLDDDDEFLPGALQGRVSLFTGHNDVDIVVTNGFEHRSGIDSPLVTLDSSNEIMKDLGGSFLRTNWFSSPAALFKSKTIDSELFNFNYKYFEWTYLFFLLLSKDKRFHYDEMLSFRKYEDNPLSVSKSLEYATDYPVFLQSLKMMPLDPIIKSKINDKYVTALNTRSNFELNQGLLLRAWISHFRCLANGGWQYLPYTRHLIFNKPSH